MYSATKAFLAPFSESLWIEHESRDVFVMALCPGLTHTEFVATATDGQSEAGHVPDFFFQSSEEVVRTAVRELHRRKKPVVVTGWINKIMMLMPRFLTRYRLIRVLTVMAEPEEGLV